MEFEKRYSCLSNHFNLISAIDHKILKFTLTWYWRHVKFYQDNQTVPLYRRASLKLEFDTAEKQKQKEDQKAGYPKAQSHNIQDKKGRLFTSVPAALNGKINTALGYKISTDLKSSIDNVTFKKPLPYC